MKTTLSSEEIASLAERYRRLYTGAIADMLDKNGYRQQVLPKHISPRTKAARVAGVAFTVQGYPAADPASNDMPKRLEMLSLLYPGAISVWGCGGAEDCAHWGELMSTAARQRGSNGAVIDGGVRDLDMVDAMEYPVFAGFCHAGSSIGRWEIREWNVAVRIGATTIHSGDFVFGDRDGVVIVPRDLIVDVLTMAEEIYQREAEMRAEIRAGTSVTDAFDKYGAM